MVCGKDERTNYWRANNHADFALKLPGFSYIPGITIPIISYWDGQPLR